jgi:peroxiredoxin
MLPLGLVLGQAKKPGFVITGKLGGYADGTLIYLDDVVNAASGHLDSTRVVNNEFRFTGFISEPARQVVLQTGNYADYKFFWLENKQITLRSETGRLRDARVSGSATQDEDNQLDSAIKATGKEMEQDTLFIRTHPHSVLSASILSVYCVAWGKALSTRLYIDLSEENRNSVYGWKVLEFIRFNKELKTGDRYADFEQPDADGRMVRLSSLHGKLVLLEFWGSWCAPCREENPELVSLYNEFREKGFEILGVAADSRREDWLKAIRDDGLTWKNVTDLRGDRNKAVLMYGVYRFPSNFLIDRSGIIVAQDLRGDSLRAKLQELLK